MNVSAWSIKNPIAGVMLFVMLTFAGLIAFNTMKVQQFPDLDLPTVVISASLPGAAPAQLETEVARKMENAIASLQGLKHIYTKVQDGASPSQQSSAWKSRARRRWTMCVRPLPGACRSAV